MRLVKNEDANRHCSTKTPIDAEAIQREIASGYINVQGHPEHDLRILNYSQKAQFDWRWNAETMQCRGLIVDGQWNVVSRPFPKFFSVDQLNGQVPDEPFDAYEKMDGSLGILYIADGEAFIASRGSFTSEQAQAAKVIYDHKYCHIHLDLDCTYLFEIIYPENRIVVDYGDMQDLVLLAVIETATGLERPLPDIGFPLAKRYDGIEDFDALMSMQDDKREGFVVRFESGQRVKVKFEEYKRLHRLLTGFSQKSIWEILRNGGDVRSIIERVPDEFHRWVRETENDLRHQYLTIESHARGCMKFCGSRGEIARHFKQSLYPDVMFAMLDGKDYQDIIWKKVKPVGSPAFRCSSVS